MSCRAFTFAAAAVAAFTLASSAVPAAHAQGRIIPRGCFGPDERPVPLPRPDTRRPRPMPMPCAGSVIARSHVGVKVELVDRVLRYEVEERFVNRGSTLGEADYVFPMPRGAAFQDLKLSIDGEMVSGETLPADEARRIYEEIVRRQRDPALVEWMGAGMLRTRIFPFNPGEERTIIVRYQVVAEREGDALRVEHRTGGEHAMAGVRQQFAGGNAGVNGTERATGAFTLSWSGSAFGTPYSPTHALAVRDRGGMREASVRGSARETFAALAGGVTILLPVRRNGAASIALLPHAPGDEDGFALLTLAPPAQRASGATPRDVTLVLDVSGSMSGRKMEQARAAARQLLSTLGPRDRFRIVDFATEVRTFPDHGVREGDDYAWGTRENVRAAERYVRELEAAGSTNISGALEKALGVRESGDRLGLVLFVTDGAPTVGERRPERIAARAAQLRGSRRVFTFGVGSDVNATLLEQLALDGRGTAHFVRPEESVEHAVSVVASRLVDPVATDLRVRVESMDPRQRERVRLNRMHPDEAQDLFASQDLVLLARYRGHGPARVVVEGRSRSGPVRWSTVVNFPERERGNPAVARLWATQRVGWLAAAKRGMGSGRETSEVDAEIRELGERFGIPTEFTSYFVKEPGMDLRGRVAGGQLRRDGALTGNAAATVAPTAAAAPTAERSFEAARTSAQQRAAKSVADLESDAGAGDGSRIVGSRRFMLSGERWTDVRFTPGMPVVRVAPWSAAYFEVLRLLPELSEPFALGERVLVVGRSVALELTPEGERELPAAAAARLRAGW